MKDLMKAWTVQEGQRSAHLTRDLHATGQIRQDRTQRFEYIHNNRLRRQERVSKIRSEFQPQGIRPPPTVRAAFDILASQMNGPKSAWQNSAEWFMATLDVINSEEDLFLALFEPRSDYFMDDLNTAMIKADGQQSLALLERKTDEEYADLMGAEAGTKFVDSFLFFKQ
jgi:hypothetical protein